MGPRGLWERRRGTVGDIRTCAAANKGARVAWVLFEMRTLSKEASEKRRGDERRKDTSIYIYIYTHTPEGEKQTRRE